jgi:hypothetical protein
MVVKSTKIYK